MKDLQDAPGIRIRGWIVVLAVAGFAQASCALAQIYKCTDADSRTAFSDKPCATPPPGAAASAGAGKDGVKQEVLRQPKSSAGREIRGATHQPVPAPHGKPLSTWRRNTSSCSGRSPSVILPSRRAAAAGFELLDPNIVLD